MSKQELLSELIRPAVEALGCELWGIEFFSQGKKSLLRIYIDKEDGIMVEDCEKVSRQVSSIFDVEDPIASHYTLEVSSPGMDRPLFSLEQFAKAIGEEVAIKLSQTFEGQKKLKGLVVAIEEDEIVLQQENEQIVLPYECIDKANVVPKF